MTRCRLDVLLVERGLAESREQAQRLIRAGKVTVGGRLADKPGVATDAAADVAVTAPASRFVSRGGDKLQAALDAFALSSRDCVCLDLGASTGGFTDCLLQGGARCVYAVDVGRAQLHEKLRQDPRVVVHEQTNARELTPARFPEPIDFCTADVSFISLLKVMPAAMHCLRAGATGVFLIKPQFEAGPRHVRKGGVVTDPAVHRDVLRQVCDGLSELRFSVRGLIPSPLRGPAGNREYLVWVAYEPGETRQACAKEEVLERAVAQAFGDARA